jgi:outer membrane assembly lipoprotein YfiO
VRARLSIRRISVVAAVLALALAGPAARGIEVWMPETGEVDLDEVEPGSLEARRAHAMALVGAGQWAGGVAELRRLIEAAPRAEWVPEAQFVIARGLIAWGRPRQAFEELHQLRVLYPESPFAERARPLQFVAARVTADLNVDDSAELYERLIDTAESQEEAERAWREKADVFFEAQRFLDAEAEYLAFVSFFPDSELVSYCWYMAAECEWQLATWLGLGLERVEAAEQHFEDFVERYPGDVRAADAQQKIEEARRERARINWEVARYYLEVEGKPWAAVNYLEYIGQEFPDTPEAERAARELAGIAARAEAPPRGQVREIPLPGALAPEPGPTAPEADQ